MRDIHEVGFHELDRISACLRRARRDKKKRRLDKLNGTFIWLVRMSQALIDVVGLDELEFNEVGLDKLVNCDETNSSCCWRQLSLGPALMARL